MFLKEKGYAIISCDVEDIIYKKLRKLDKNRFDYKFLLAESNLISKIDEMTGDDFEDFICWLFDRLGYNVTKTKSGADQGVDLIYSNGSISTGVQIKRWKKKIGNSAIQAVFSGKSYYHCDKALVITNNYFTRGSQETCTEL